MKKQKSLILSVSFLFLFAATASAQTDTAEHDVTMQVDPIAVLDIHGTDITLTVEAPAIGGETPSNPQNDTCWLQYTSTVGSDLTRSINVNWAGDTAPSGCILWITATPSGNLNEGASAGAQSFEAVLPKNVITGIGSCATGIGFGNGANLFYTLAVDTMTSLVAGESNTATVTYTLLDDS
ncbi:hypothetical protein ACFLRM_05790 [Acidobacteriota bacterium]